MIHLIIHLVIYLQGMQYIISHDPFLVSCEKNFYGKAAWQQVSWPQSQRRWWQFARSSGAMICWWSPCLPSRLWEQALNFELFFGGCRVWGGGASIVLFASTPVQPTRIQIWNMWWDRDLRNHWIVGRNHRHELSDTFSYLQYFYASIKRWKKEPFSLASNPTFLKLQVGLGRTAMVTTYELALTMGCQNIAWNMEMLLGF